MKFIRKTLLYFSCIGFSMLGLEANILTESEGDKPIADCLPSSNSQTYFNLDLLAKQLAKEKYPVLALYQICRQSLEKTTDNPSASIDFAFNFSAYSDAEFEKEFIRLCHLLGIDTKKASVRGKSVYDFCIQGDDWSCLDLTTGQFYLGWDNTTLVSSEALLDDPLLMLRSKSARMEAFDFTKAWQELARLEIIAPAYSSNLNANENAHVFKSSNEADEKSGNPSSCLINVLNQTKEFQFCSPSFSLAPNNEHAPELLWWQISSDKEFKTVPFNLEEIQPFANKISLPLITETFLSADDTYYFRVKGCREGQWGEWSQAFKFSARKPHAISLIEFDKCADGQYEINWERDAQSSDTPIEYLIFGSNAFDFIPSIYGGTQPQEMVNGKITVEDAENNLITITTDTKILVDGRLAYYRIIARQNGQLSVPSPIIHVYDNDLIQPRTVLQIVEASAEKMIAKRILFPATYPWTETALPQIGMSNRSYENSLLNLESIILSLTQVSESSSYLQGEGYIRPSNVSKELWEKMKPYFLPENHPWKQKIDRIFARSRASISYDTLRKSGFKGKVTHVRRIFAGVHPECVECFFKIYCDSEVHMRYPEWQKWLDRINGKERVKACIKKYGFEKWFSVPDKWCYPLPEHPACPRSTRLSPKNFILVCSNQRPYDHSDNEKKWKTKLTKPILDALYILIDEAGMWDSVFAFNVPFCKPDGKMCFVDTEYSHKWPIRFEKLSKYMSSSSRKYWEHLIRHNGPPEYKSAHPHH